MTATKLGIIAGGGDLPKHIINRCRQQNRPYFVLAFKGQTDPRTVADSEHAWVNVGAVGKAIDHMRSAKVQDLVMVGPLRRPSWYEIRPDAVGAKWLAKIAKHAMGDDSLFRVINQELEQEGFNIIGAEDLIGDEILAPYGIFSEHLPDTQAYQDIERGVQVALALGAVDVGQAVVVQQGIVLGVEAIEGTNCLLERCGELKRPNHGGILIKIGKPGQDRRVDLPTIGPETIEKAKAAGIRGLALEANTVQILYRDETIKLANKLGLFLTGIEVPRG